ncbi:alpha/beta hydrolase family protein [Pseudomonas sp. R-28-1W-6]|uniref:alpha/beta hydrolase family protein n=1 Tax=Pseudomonas sp. R-28-1W-6 TaxID=2650101 RepID=UPI003557BD76
MAPGAHGAPYGEAPLWSAQQAAAASRDFAELHVAHGGLLWVEFDPQRARCGLFLYRDGTLRELTPPGFSVRSRVYEYGGGACCATSDGAAFVNETDQQLHLVGLGVDDGPRALTARPHCRYGDLSYVAAWQALLAVEESHEPGGVIHRLLRIGLDGSRRVLVEGADFYAGPVASADGTQLAWIEWDRPQQPWTATRLCRRMADGAAQVLAGAGAGQSLQQPRFASDGRLWVLTDRTGWWQPLCIDAGPCAHGAPYDHAAAPWQLGGCTYLPLADGGLLLTRFEQGFGLLLEQDGQGGERRLAAEFSRFRGLAADATHFYCIAGSPSRLPAVLAINRQTGAAQVLAGGEQPLPAAAISRPQAFDYASGGERAHGFFYAAQGNEARPPLLIFLHGGPTSACYPVFDPRIPFWTQRGFAVADLNYRGSSGYGRAYRQRLQGEWGRIEVEDIQAAAAHLATEGLIDGARVFVRGASAGGYSALCALAGASGLRGGASLYGVSDPLALRRATHKFEADYLDWLIGDPERDAARYRERTPLLQAARIRVPLIFFQGGLDAVVVPAQTESMVAALRGNGLAVEYHLYPDERHGFRQATHLAEVLERELAFYGKLLR